ncbi:MAG: hypothetical protein KOO60_11960 [Gemmatimonadales bacterium]|nr:hypothetical protein [Gemmatimonadales bacterium]
MMRFPVLMSIVLLSCLLSAMGCRQEKPDLELKDLTTAENLYLTRIVVLERAKAVTLVDRKTGTALLDSLAAAWGDTSLATALAGAPANPSRSARVHELLIRVLKAERDSLLKAPRPDRLAAPLPDPPPDDKNEPSGS